MQEAFDSRGVAQPEIAEKTRACEAYGAEVIRLSVGPELFYVFLCVLRDTGYFNASLYTPYSILGIETLGHELAVQTREQAGRFPDLVIATHAGGGNVTGTARGLAAAHACGIIHRDIKPANLMLSSEGHICITDFGLARLAQEPGMTMSGSLIGTPAYMSPEQAVGDKDIDGRSDVYALGALLYTMLAGRPPHAVEGLPRPEVARILEAVQAYLADVSIRAEIGSRFESSFIPDIVAWLGAGGKS